MNEKEMYDKKDWEEFRKTGLLWLINTILHTFGWSLIVEYEDGKVVNTYPARVKFRGFDETSQTIGYRNITHFLKENIDDLMKEVEE